MIADNVPVNKSIVEIHNLSFHREGRMIFNGLNLQIPRGKITAIMGTSGTGKTTLLNLIGGQLKPTGGQIFVEGVDVARCKLKTLYALRQRIGMLYQNGALFTDLNVFDNVAFPLREHTRLPEDMIRDLVLLKLEAVGLRGARTLLVNELSGGMARRVALARALALDPDLMLYDEPFTGQDPITKAVLLQLIKQMNEALGITSILVSHDVEETAKIADYICVLSSGEMVSYGTAAEVMGDQSAFVKQFMHGLPDGPVQYRYPASTLVEDFDHD